MAFGHSAIRIVHGKCVSEKTASACAAPQERKSRCRTDISIGATGFGFSFTGAGMTDLGRIEARHLAQTGRLRTDGFWRSNEISRRSKYSPAFA